MAVMLVVKMKYLLHFRFAVIKNSLKLILRLASTKYQEQGPNLTIKNMTVKTIETMCVASYQYLEADYIL